MPRPMPLSLNRLYGFSRHQDARDSVSDGENHAQQRSQDKVTNMRNSSPLLGICTTAMATVMAGIASAQNAQEAVLGDLPRIGKPIQDGHNFQPPTTELARDIQWFDNFLLWYIGIITLFVTALIIWVIIRHNARANPTPATFTHNTPLEITWIVLPAISLAVIALFLSLPILFKQLEIPEADITIKATGNQWYWSYDYTNAENPDEEFSFDAIMLARDELEEYGYQQDEFLLATDYAVVLPVNKTVVMQVTGSDVIHAWKIPSFGVHMDAVPGRLAEIWFKPEEEGIFFGQCSELCGKDHSYMPIVVKVVSEEKYAEWLVGAREEFAGKPRSINVAAAE